MYKLTTDPNTIILLPTTYIPRSNSLWADFEDWLGAGNIPEPADIIPEPIIKDWVNFNIELLQNTGYKTWAKATRKSNTDDELYYQNLTISVGIQNGEAAQFYYDLIAAKPPQTVRDAANVLAKKYNIGVVF